MSATEYTSPDGTRYRRTDDGGVEWEAPVAGNWFPATVVSVADMDAIASLLLPKYATLDNASVYARTANTMPRDVLERAFVAAMLDRDLLGLTLNAHRHLAAAQERPA